MYEEPNLDIQDDQEFVDKKKNQHKIIVQFTISNPTHLTVANAPDYSNVELYDGHGTESHMLTSTLNYDQPHVFEAGESGIYKINYLTDGMDHLRSFMVMQNGSFQNKERILIFSQLIVKVN